jgi:signal transduction histidine kinase/DNA-binding response OmpR family regulator
MPPLRILIVEDNALDTELAAAALDEAGIRYELRRVDSESAYTVELQTPPDVILSDYMLPSFSGTAALRIAREMAPEVPFIFVSGALGEELAIELLKSGATDYVFKHRLARLAPAVERAVREAAERRDRARVEAGLRQSEGNHRRLVAQLDAIIGSMNEGLIVADPIGNVLSMNSAALKLHEFEPGEDFRQQIADLPKMMSLSTMDGTPLPTERWPLTRVLRGETFSNYEVWVHRHRTGRRWVANYAGAPVRNTGGQVEMVLITFRDVTAQKRIEADLAAAKEQAEDANRMKDQFLATLSHELRTPLNAILGWTQLLLMDPSDPEELLGGLKTIERNAHAQTQLVEDLLDVSRIISGKLLLNSRPMSFAAVVDAAVEATRPAADGKGVRLIVEAHHGPLPMTGDPARLQQVAANLLTNAIKFTPPHGAVTVELAGGDDRVRLSVRDTGQGIPVAFLPHVFERFRQADGSSSRRHGGLGLGLSIVRYIVDGHHGTVTADSNGPGTGALFTVVLPVAALESDFVEPGKPVAVAATAGRLAGVRVLVVEDEPDARSFVAAALTKQGAAVTAVGSVAEAMEQFRRAVPDVIISDLAMPGEDGFSLIRQIRSLPPDSGGNTRAAALTAYARPEDRARTLEAGFEAHVTKPVNAADLIMVVTELARAKPTPAD